MKARKQSGARADSVEHREGLKVQVWVFDGCLLVESDGETEIQLMPAMSRGASRTGKRTKCWFMQLFFDRDITSSPSSLRTSMIYPIGTSASSLSIELTSPSLPSAICSIEFAGEFKTTREVSMAGGVASEARRPSLWRRELSAELVRKGRS